MDKNRMKGKKKELEGEAQQAWGKTKDKVDELTDKARDAADDLKRDDKEREAARR